MPFPAVESSAMRYRLTTFEESVLDACYIVLAEPLDVQWQADNHHGQVRIRIVSVLLARREWSHQKPDPAIAPGQIVTLTFATARPNVESLQSPWLALIDSPLGTEGRFACDRDHPFKPAVVAERVPAILASRPK
jgi:hypothetical protein